MLARVAATRRLRWYVIGVALGLTLLVGASRIYLGVHYPSDVFAGWTAGRSLGNCLVAGGTKGRRQRAEG